MQTGPGAIEEYARAVASEKAAWEAVRDRLPGSADFDQELWNQWRRCVDEADQAGGRVKSRIGLPAGKPSGPRFPGGAWPQAVQFQLPRIFSRLRPPQPKG